MALNSVQQARYSASAYCMIVITMLAVLALVGMAGYLVYQYNLTNPPTPLLTSAASTASTLPATGSASGLAPVVIPYNPPMLANVAAPSAASNAPPATYTTEDDYTD